MENIFEDDEHKNSNERDACTEDMYTYTDTAGIQKLRFIWTEAKARNFGKNRRFVLSIVCLGLMCVLLGIGIIVQHHKLTEERDLLKMSYMDIEKEYNQTNNRLLVNYSDQTIAKDRLQSSFNSLNQTNLELETRVNSLTIEKDQLQSSFNSLNQKKLELESKVNTSCDGHKKNQVWFFISSEEKSWYESRQFCRDRGGDLVIINTEEKQRYVSSLVNGRAWIGLSDIENEGNMKWVDNSPLKKGFWNTNEPNDDEGKEDCVEVLSSNPFQKNWNDLPCSEKRKWICEN
ncbi:CD209 antigen-like protein C [Xyrauchen texanus]|uniref:CD209 antigen-like protein C n=1 Tax=Xyrauchen texanus TaxID=154827 RepID=UPI002242C4EE|nr:CD209 antigen-like protein C [Xyrauchen texanus]